MTQTLLLGSHRPVVEAALEQLTAQRFLQRLWDRDASLWSSDAQTQAAIRNRLGWLRIADVMAGNVSMLQTVALEIRKAGFRHVLLLGMGGSGLFSEVCRNTFGAAAGHPDLTVLDTTDPSAVGAAQQASPLEHLLVIISSKSGSTSEISALSKYFYETFRAADGQPGAHCLAITDAGTSLEEQARAWRCRRIFTHGQATGSDVGGRFSALTYFGLVPASLLGIDAGKLLERARAMMQRCAPTVLAQENPAAQLGSVLGSLVREGRDKMTLLCAPHLSSFGTWVEQLIAESVGKQGKGIAPIHGEVPRDPADYGQDRVFVELQLADRIDPTVDRHVSALAKAGHPVIRVHWSDAYDLGGEVAKWSVATAVIGGLMGINPFDEPNVKESKDRTKTLLSLYVADHRFPSEFPLLSESNVIVYGAVRVEVTPQSLRECLSALFQSGQPGDYAAVLSFLSRTASLDRAVHGIRELIANGSGRATMVGFGPRYLHSTGQLYKGGPDRGLFLLLTGDDPVDLPIPGEPFTFSVLKQAQALGDFQAMQDKHRRILRFHLRGDLDKGIQQLSAAVREAVAIPSAR